MQAFEYDREGRRHPLAEGVALAEPERPLEMSGDDYRAHAAAAEVEVQAPGPDAPFYLYDARGWVTERREGGLRSQYSYDARGCLTQIRQGDTVTSYVYEPDRKVRSPKKKSSPSKRSRS